MWENWMILYDQVFGSHFMSEAITLNIMDSKEQIHIGVVERILEDHWWSGEYWDQDWRWGQNTAIVVHITHVLWEL